MFRAHTPGEDALVLEWHRGATNLPFQSFRQRVLASLDTVIPHDAAVWALGRGAHTPEAAWVARPDAPTAQQQAALGGAVAMACRRPGAVVRPDPGVLALAAVGPADRRPPQGIALVRGSGPFDDEDARRLVRLVPHAVQALLTAWRFGLLRAAAPGKAAGWKTALVDREGRVCEALGGLADLLDAEWPGWDGQQLPPPLCDLMPRSAESTASYRGAQVVVRLTAHGDTWLLAARPRVAADSLTDRERQIAQRYAAGGTYTEIAEQMQVSPATVRSHLRNVYAKLSVTSKAQIAALIGS